MENVKGKLVNQDYVIQLIGRVDSSNAKEIEEAINALKNDFIDKPLVIDADELEYISSAGLRIVLRLLKEHPKTKIINVSSSVYEVFEMTGFTQLLSIQKGYRHLSVAGCEAIGKGANGAVYRIDPDTIIKVYVNKDALPDIQRETDLARKAFVLGIPTAIPYDVVKVGDGYGSVFELLACQHLTQILSHHPEKFDECVHQYVELLKKIHATHVKPGDMPDMKMIALDWASYLKDYLDPVHYEKLLYLINAVPTVDTMIHGDYHTKNVMIQDGEPLLIDMDTISVGHPVFEIASMFLAFIGYGEVDHKTATSFIGIPWDMAHDFFYQAMREYLNTTDENLVQSVIDKGRIIGYTRVIRRTIRRENYQLPETKEKVEHYRKELYELLDRCDDLTF